MYEGYKNMMLTFRLEQSWTRDARTHKFSWGRKYSTVFVAVDFRHQWNTDFALMAVFTLMQLFCEWPDFHRCLRLENEMMEASWGFLVLLASLWIKIGLLVENIQNESKE